MGSDIKIMSFVHSNIRMALRDDIDFAGRSSLFHFVAAAVWGSKWFCPFLGSDIFRF